MFGRLSPLIQPIISMLNCIISKSFFFVGGGGLNFVYCLSLFLKIYYYCKKNDFSITNAIYDLFHILSFLSLIVLCFYLFWCFSFFFFFSFLYFCLQSDLLLLSSWKSENLIRFHLRIWFIFIIIHQRWSIAVSFFLCDW